MQFNFISPSALILLVFSVAAEGIHLGGKRAPMADDCKRAASVLPSVSLQTTATDPQPTAPGTGSGGFGNKNGTTPSIVNPSSASATSATESKSGAGTIRLEWTMGALAAAGVAAMAI